MKKLLTIVAHFPPIKCGVGSYAYKISKYFAKKHEVSVICNSEVEHSFHESESFRLYNILENFTLSDYLKIKRLIGEIIPDIINIHYHGNDFMRRVTPAFFPFTIKRFFPNIPIVSTMHNFQRPHSLPNISMRSFLEFSDRIIVTNEEELHKMEERFPGFYNKTSLIPVSAGIEWNGKKHEFSSITLEKIPKGSKIISFFGFINPEKGVDTLIDAFEKVHEKDSKVHLLMIGDIHTDKSGELHEYYKSIINRIRRKNLDDFISFTGFCNDFEASNYMLLSDLMVFPFKKGLTSKRSSFLSALSHEKPIISTNSKFLPDGIKNNENCIIVEPGDALSLGDAILKILYNESLKNTLSKNARSLFLKRYSWDSLYEEMEKILFLKT